MIPSLSQKYLPINQILFHVLVFCLFLKFWAKNKGINLSTNSNTSARSSAAASSQQGDLQDFELITASLVKVQLTKGSEEMKITIKGSTMVDPAEDTPKRNLWNSNLDLVISRYHVALVFFYRSDGSSNFFETQLLKESLSKILVSFYPMAGRLGYDENGRLEIVCNAEGVLFIEAETTTTLDDLRDFAPSSKLRQLVPTIDYSGDISSFPLLLLQVTTFKCGGVCLGSAFQHTLVDGTSVFHFMNSWSNITRGLSVSVTPFIDRTLLRPRVPPPSPTFHHVEYDPSPPLKHQFSNPDSQAGPKPSSTSIFKITADQLKTLKAKANINGNVPTKYSTYNILTAHIWRCVCKARGLSDDQATKLYIPIDGRFKLHPPLPPGYLGNVVFIAATIALSGDLQSEPFVNTIERINRVVKQMDDKYMRSALEYIESVADMKTLMRGAHTFQSPNLAINSWMRLPVYAVDFGWGRPIHVGLANVIHEGKIYVVPSPIDDGSLSLVVCLETSHMKLFQMFLYDYLLPFEKINSRY